MKKKILALTLVATLTLSSTSVFAATTTCTKSNYDLNSLKNYICNLDNRAANITKVTANVKTVDLNSVDSKSILNAKQTATKPVATQQAEPSNTTASSSVSSYEQKVVELVNVERQKAGLSSLTLDTAISNIARMKSKDMATNNYFAHQSPTYGSAGDMLTKNGIKWSAWGENIASGQKTPQEVVTAWMNSPGHKANIMSTNFSKLGVGYALNSNGTPYWTQMFTN